MDAPCMAHGSLAGTPPPPDAGGLPLTTVDASPQEKGPAMDSPSFLDRVPFWAKVFAFSFALLGVGWSGAILFSEQTELPGVVDGALVRVDTLEARMDRAEEAVADIALNTLRLQSLGVKVDSLDALASDTYCLVRAHALSLDPLAECTLSQRGRRNAP